MNPFKPDFSSFKTYYEKAQFLLAFRISVFFSLLFVPLSVFYVLSSWLGGIITATSGLISIAAWIYLYKTKQFQVIFWLILISGFLLIHFSMNFVLGSSHYVDLLWIVSMVYIAFIGMSRTVGWVFIGLNALGLLYFYLFSIEKVFVSYDPNDLAMLSSEILELFLAMATIGYLAYLNATINAYSRRELELTNEELSAKNIENTFLMKEVHHRVKNNLQIITSMLRMQKAEIPDNEQMPFNEAIDRIMSMSLIHQKLYRKESLSEVELNDYLVDLGTDIKHSHGYGDNIDIKVQAGDLSLDMEVMVPFGLITNELITNSLKHAFSSESKGTIEITVQSTGGRIQMRYSDSGNWISPVSETKSFGLDLIDTLVEQLEGTFDRKDSAYHFSFPVK